MDTVVPTGDKKMDESNNTDLAEVKNKPVYKEYNNSEDGLEILSKRAQKKLLKRKLWLESKPERRAKEKAKQKAKIDRIRQTKGFDQTFKEHRKHLKQKKMSDSPCKVTVVIDMGFEHLMNQRDLGKCLKQLMHCYSINRRLENPLQFHITSFIGERLKNEMSRHHGYENWDCIFHSDSYVEVFSASNICDKDAQKISDTVTDDSDLLLTDSNQIKDIKSENQPSINAKKVIYLTSESDNILEHFDANCIYVIGGLVDHNHHKGICHRLALEKGVSHARFPIQESGIDMKTRQVLTIDHVFRIIASVASEGQTWKDALVETLPERKGAIDITKINGGDSKNKCDEKNTLVIDS